jgi:hypothetical protein
MAPVTMVVMSVAMMMPETAVVPMAVAHMTMSMSMSATMAASGRCVSAAEADGAEQGGNAKKAGGCEGGNLAEHRISPSGLCFISGAGRCRGR